MKRIVSTVFAVLLTVMLFSSALPVSAATGSVAVSANSTSVTVGQTVKVTVKYSAGVNLGSLDATLTYDASIMEYVSADGVSANGNAGTVKLSWYETSASPSKTRSFTLTFKSKKTGSCTFALSTGELSDWDFNSLGVPSGKVTVSVKNPQKSSNANISKLYISSGTLSPKFSPDVTTYHVTVPYSVTVFTVSVTAADKDAAVAVEGSKNMKVGKNTRVIKITAPNGTVKSYTIHITRQEKTAEDTEPDTTPQTPAEDASKVTVGEEIRYISKMVKEDQIPLGYVKGEVTVGDVTYPAAKDKSGEVTLLYLLDDQKKNGAFYMYDQVTKAFSNFIAASSPTGVYTLLTPSASLLIPSGFTQSFIKIEEQTVTAFAFPAEQKMQEFYLVYALSPSGNKGLYCYDTKEGTFQRYVVKEELPTVTQPDPQPVEKPANIFVKAWNGVKGAYQSLLARFGGLRLGLLAGCGVLLIAAIVVLIVLLAKRPKNCKH